MTLYSYIKAPPGHTLKRSVSFGRYVRLVVSIVLLTLGVASFTSVAYPLIMYQLVYAPGLKKEGLISPVVTSTLEIPPAKASEPTILPEMVNNSLNYTDSDFWYPQAKTINKDTLVYSFSIPKLGIKDVTVRNDHTDLRQSLIHYPGTADPGDLGNTVIFGHSVLPQYFNPANYTTIFSTVHTLKKGNEIFLTDNGATYRYVIIEMYEAMPDDLSPLAQSYDNRYLTLITCTPPGTYLRRLIVRAVLT